MPTPLELPDLPGDPLGLAHEVRNHLGAIMNAVALIRRGASDLEALCGIIEEEASSIHELVDGGAAAALSATSRSGRSR